MEIEPQGYKGYSFTLPELVAALVQLCLGLIQVSDRYLCASAPRTQGGLAPGAPGMQLTPRRPQ